ncbi:MAG: glycosyltransferase family 2 protein [Peptococcaceae bacterium]|nr:glycosyltransferase family 2 protein [Peptococcaceae bacterium]
MVSVVIPAFNEADRIGDTVRAAKSLPGIDEIVVVDDCSNDGTADEAAKNGARVLRLPYNQGKGQALNHGIREARGDILVFLDGDLGATAKEAAKLIQPILRDEADLTVGCFPKARKKGGFGLVKGLARYGIARYTGLNIQSPISGQRAMRRRVAEKLLPLASGYGVEVYMTIMAARHGFRILEVPVNMTHRETGRDLKGFLHRGRQFRDIFLTLVRLKT